MSLEIYNQKRDFSKTKEPPGKKAQGQGNMFVAQEHYASRHHFDFRLELDGALKSWAVPKGPSLNPAVKRLAVHVEDHPLEYGSFEGVIPKGEYGAGKVILWDTGQWLPVGDPGKSYERGKLEFELRGRKLKGRWLLIRARGQKGPGKEQWLLMKKKDQYASDGEEVTLLKRESVKEALAPPRLEEPQLAALRSQAPDSEGYIHEVKFDGYRTLAKVESGRASLFTRKLLDWTHRYPDIARALMNDAFKEAQVDGEVVWLGEDGVSSFKGLQDALKNEDGERMYYYVFDVLSWEGEDVRGLPQVERKELARTFVERVGNERVRFSEELPGDGPEVFKLCCEAGLEGIVSKRVDAPYESGRGDNWIKIKCQNDEDYSIAGFIERKDAKEEVGALILAVQEDNGDYSPAGKVGAGFDRRQRRELYQLLEPLKRDSAIFKQTPKMPDAVWVEPRHIARVRSSETTAAGKLRHPVYLGLREDLGSPLPKESFSAPELKALVSSPDKVLYPKAGITKLEIAEYYNEAYPFMMSHLRGKFLSLLKCPQGLSGDCFYSKHPGNMRNLDIATIENKGETERYVSVSDLKGLIYLVRYNTMEIHIWNARVDRPRRPDEIVFDLDPDEGMAPSSLIEGALAVKEVLENLGIATYPKATGGKGLHLHAPLARKYDTEQVYQFAKSVAYILEQDMPERFTSNVRLEKRKGKIFIDYLRNSFGASYICPFSLRAKEYAPLALPLSWEQVKNGSLSNPPALKDFLKTLRLKRFKSPWEGYWESAQQIDIFE